MELTRYPSYKPSGIEWIGEIPSHWDLKRLKYVALVQPSNVDKKSEEGESPILLCNYMDVYNNEFIDASIQFMAATATENEIEKFTIRRGDVLVTKDSETPDDIASPALVKIDFNQVLCGYHLTHIRPNGHELIGEYLFRLFQSDRYNGQFEISANGVTRFGLSASVFSGAYVPLPPPSEQTAIAAYLDEKTAQIDKLISAKQRMIELLREERQAVINEAVNGEGKGWVRRKLKYVLKKIGSGVTPRGGSETYIDSGVLFLRSQNILNEGLDLDDVVFISDAVDEEMQNSRVDDGDVLLNITGASIGRCCVVPSNLGRANVNQHVCILRPDQLKIESHFLYAFLISNTGQTFIDSFQSGANREGLNYQQIKAFEIALPPSISEQKDIVVLIKEKSEHISNSMIILAKEVNLLKEYRNSLINEVVTGKHRVHEEKIGT